MSLRLDLMMTKRKIAETRSKAKELILSSKVRVNGKVVTKPSCLCSDKDEICVTENLKYVSKGGLKLEKAVEEFKIDLADKTCVDFGASTGGFTDCMLCYGAGFVYAVDVGHGQLALKLIEDKRVKNIEKTNIKNLPSDLFDRKIDFCCVDVSFISLFHAAKPVYDALSENGEAVMLIKPQFEAGKSRVSKGGIVKDKKAHIDVINSVLNNLRNTGFEIIGLCFSPVKGGDGNIEYLVYVKKISSPHADFADLKYIRQLVDDSFKYFKNK